MTHRDEYQKTIDELVDMITSRDEVQYMAGDRAIARFNIDPKIITDDIIDDVMNSAEYQRAFDQELAQIFRDIMQAAC